RNAEWRHLTTSGAGWLWRIVFTSPFSWLAKSTSVIARDHPCTMIYFLYCHQHPSRPVASTVIQLMIIVRCTATGTLATVRLWVACSTTRTMLLGKKGISGPRGDYILFVPLLIVDETRERSHDTRWLARNFHSPKRWAVDIVADLVFRARHNEVLE